MCGLDLSTPFIVEPYGRVYEVLNRGKMKGEKRAVVGVNEIPEG